MLHDDNLRYPADQKAADDVYGKSSRWKSSVCRSLYEPANEVTKDAPDSTAKSNPD